MTNDMVALTTAALRLGMSYTKAWNWVLAGKLKGKKDQNGKWVVDASDLNRLVKQREADH